MTIKISDLNRNEELSSASARQVAGGMSCDQGHELCQDLYAAGNFFRACGLDQAADKLMNQGYGVVTGACGPDA